MTIIINTDDFIGEVEEDRIALLLGEVLGIKSKITNAQTGNTIVSPIEDLNSNTEFQWLLSKIKS